MDPTLASRQTERHPLLVTRGKVLLVEPDSRDRQYISGILRQRGFEVYACASYEEGVRCLDSGGADLLLIEQGSRAFEGRVLLERAVMLDRRLPVFVLTRSVDMGCYLEAMQLGAVDYLEKPLAPEEIAQIVANHLRPRFVAA